MRKSKTLPSNEGRKDDQEKVRLDLLPIEAMYEVAEIMTLGARKYADRNWEQGINYNRLFRAAMGHLWDWWLKKDYGKGPGMDKESGRSHLAHAACCVLFLLTFELRKLVKFDNRPKLGEGPVRGLDGQRKVREVNGPASSRGHARAKLNRGRRSSR